MDKKQNCFLTLYHTEPCAQAMQKVMKKTLLPLQEAMEDRLTKRVVQRRIGATL